MLEIVLTPKILGPPKIGALGLSLFSLMVNLRLRIGSGVQRSGDSRGGCLIACHPTKFYSIAQDVW